LYLGKVNRRELRWKVRMYAGEKATFQKGGWHLRVQRSAIISSIMIWYIILTCKHSGFEANVLNSVTDSKQMF